MPLMQPQQSPQQPNTPPANIGQSEPDQQPFAGQSTGMAPQMPQQQGQPAQDMSVNNDGSQPGQNAQAVQQRLDALPDHDKQFLSQYLTPEFVYALGLVAGPETAQYLNQFTDQNKVLVPVSRQEAGRIQAEVKKSQQGRDPNQPGPATLNTPQGNEQGPPMGNTPAAINAGAQNYAGNNGQPLPAQSSLPPSMILQNGSPSPGQPTMKLPNGVTPAPMQGGVMAPR